MWHPFVDVENAKYETKIEGVENRGKAAVASQKNI